ncbi:unnamed protein product [Didymodactylos carnosus]|uniref:Uncharacterized protein n=1 Tax=Didymodactylos carnosus TaxID=1234261 RepID=A0A813WDJ3_9BILA|nr:unnamed protein product [Didymodactylos carnosus]CAF0959251.1 unnamed protein product [Didymodactylos carnosus]CAF3639488.1 unnamed protein product [Didymodactylos carnosus]CAF3732086.1 unnamed protein product [Didymodactylos carnosus]
MSCEAATVYALLLRNYRVSRNTRAIWQFQQIASTGVIKVPSLDEIRKSSDEIVLLSVLDKNGNQIKNAICTPSTRFSYFTMRYKFSFILDMTDSCASVSVDGCHVYLEALTNCLCILLCSLAQTFALSGCDLKFNPEIYVSVYVYFPLNCARQHQILIHGYKLSWINESSSAIINMLSYGITTLQLMPEEATAGLIIITDGILDVPANLQSFESVMRQIRTRIISCSFIQIGSNMAQKSGCNGCFGLGNIPNEELLKFIAMSTFGSYISFDVDHINCGPHLLKKLFSNKSGDGYTINTCEQLNEFQYELLSWGFHKAVGEQFNKKSLLKRDSLPTIKDGQDEHFKKNMPTQTLSKLYPTLPISRKNVCQTVLQTSLENVLCLRLREGYTVKRVCIQRDEIEVHLVLPWLYDIQIYYTARSAWPLYNSVRTDIRVYKEAPAYFLYELHHSTASCKGSVVKGNLARRYNDVVQSVSIMDRHLTLINTFASNPAYYNVPETIKRGTAIFMLSRSSELQQTQPTKDNNLQLFAEFWRPIVVLDGSLWQRFMYTHNLCLILMHDPLPTSFVPLNNNNHLQNTQHPTVSCRIAKTDFEQFLADYFSFVLLEGQAYIKFLYKRENDEIPHSFMLLRIIGQPPLLYLKFAFQAGCATLQRHKIIAEFRERLSTLRQKTRLKSATEQRKQQLSNGSLTLDRPSSTNSHYTSQKMSTMSSYLRRDAIDSSCCFIINKNIERLLIRPDSFPYHLCSIQTSDEHSTSRLEFDPKRQALSRFFYWKTWIRSFETARHHANIPKMAADIVLDTFIRRRLHEGFHFAASHNDIHNLVLEVKMNTNSEESFGTFSDNDGLKSYMDDKIQTCLIQYIIYPIQCGRPIERKVSGGTDRRGSSNIEPPMFYYIVTQCWIEPQHGVIETNASELKFLNNCTYKEIVNKILFQSMDIDPRSTKTVTLFLLLSDLDSDLFI